MNTQKQAQKITDQIRTITTDTQGGTGITATYHVSDDSVQTELRLSATWDIRIAADEIHYPKCLGDSMDEANQKLWREMRSLSYKIGNAAVISETRVPEGLGTTIIKIHERAKNGLALREEAKAAWLIETGKLFLAEYRRLTRPAHLAKVRKAVADLQTAQKALLPALRAANSEYLAGKKSEREALKVRNAEALKSGRFWEADAETLKGYFSPPFDKNFVADISEKWRAALILECESVSYQWGYGNWGHKLAGTGRGYLCGIDDNGDEWGHACHVAESIDRYDNLSLDATVEDAMSSLFGIPVKALADCERQGDLLFCRTEIQTEDVILHPETTWQPRESHVLTSPDLSHNGVYFRSGSEITITHTSHATHILPPGEYRLYMLRTEDAD